MCPLWPLHILVMYALLLWPLLMVSCGVAAQVADKLTPSSVSAEAIAQRLQSGYSAPRFQVRFEGPEGPRPEGGGGGYTDLRDRGLELHMDEKKLVTVYADPGGDGVHEYDQVYVESRDQDVADTEVKRYLIGMLDLSRPLSWKQAFNVTGVFLGKTEVYLRLRTSRSGVVEDRLSDPLPVVVTRRKRVIDKVFTASVATLVAIIFVNFGCALDWQVVKETVRRPVGPVIGFTSQYVIMPVVSFGLAKLLFPDNTAMQLGMFFTGVSPGGGASNVWTCLLGGNLNLSITMTTLSTLAAFGMMPLWIFSLGRLIFQDGKLAVPYARVSEVAFTLVVPVFIGWLIQRYAPRVSKFMVRILKPFSALLIAFIVIFAIVTNLYIFKLFTWKIVVAGLGLPWLGYMCGLILAAVFRQKTEDILAISVETGVHNTGIAIFMLRFALGQPEADLTTVVPVAIACMTPIPLTIFYVVKLLKQRWSVQKKSAYPGHGHDEERAPMASNHIEPLTKTLPITSISGNPIKNI